MDRIDERIKRLESRLRSTQVDLYRLAQVVRSNRQLIQLLVAHNATLSPILSITPLDTYTLRTGEQGVIFFEQPAAFESIGTMPLFEHMFASEVVP